MLVIEKKGKEEWDIRYGCSVRRVGSPSCNIARFGENRKGDGEREVD